MCIICNNLKTFLFLPEELFLSILVTSQSRFAQFLIVGLGFSIATKYTVCVKNSQYVSFNENAVGEEEKCSTLSKYILHILNSLTIKIP